MDYLLQKKYINYYAATLIIFFVVIRICTLYIFNIEPFEDAADYLIMANTFSETGFMQDNYGNVAFFHVGYPLLLSAIFFIFDYNIDYAYCLNIILSTFSFVILFYISKRILPSFWCLLPLLIWGLYPPSIILVHYIFKENLMILLMLCQIYLLCKTLDSYTHFKGIFLGILFGAQLLVGSAIAFTGFIILYILWQKNNVFLEKASAFLIFFISCFLTLMPWLSYTHHHLGKAVIGTNLGYNLYVGNNPKSNGTYKEIKDKNLLSKIAHIKKTKGEIKKDNFLRDLAVNYMKNNIGKTFLLTGQRILNFWAIPLHKGKGSEYNFLESILRIFWAGLFSTVMILSLGSLHYRSRLKPEYYIIFYTIILYALTYAFFFFKFRFRLPIMPMPILLASISLFCLGTVSRS